MIHILHLSDIHLGTSAEAKKYFMQLETDLKHELMIEYLDYIVISGDITKYSIPDEYKAASELIDRLCGLFRSNSGQIIISPGNHDLNWDISAEAYIYVPKHKKLDSLKEECIPAGDAGALKRDDELYKKRFENFSTHFFKKLYGDHYPSDYSKQGILHFQPEDRIFFLALNSCWNIDHHFKKRASINMEALVNAFSQMAQDNWLKIAVCHHPVTGKEMMNNEFLQLLTVKGFQICMHGHIHEAQEGFYKYDSDRGIHIIGAGTFGAPAKEQVAGIPLQYNLLMYDSEKQTITVETRKKEKPDGAWAADARWGNKKDPKPRYTIKLRQKGTDSDTEISLKQEEDKYSDEEHFSSNKSKPAYSSSSKYVSGSSTKITTGISLSERSEQSEVIENIFDEHVKLGKGVEKILQKLLNELHKMYQRGQHVPLQVLCKAISILAGNLALEQEQRINSWWVDFWKKILQVKPHPELPAGAWITTAPGQAARICPVGLELKHISDDHFKLKLASPLYITGLHSVQFSTKGQESTLYPLSGGLTKGKCNLNRSNEIQFGFTDPQQKEKHSGPFSVYFKAHPDILRNLGAGNWSYMGKESHWCEINFEQAVYFEDALATADRNSSEIWKMEDALWLKIDNIDSWYALNKEGKGFFWLRCVFSAPLNMPNQAAIQLITDVVPAFFSSGNHLELHEGDELMSSTDSLSFRVLDTWAKRPAEVSEEFVQRSCNLFRSYYHKGINNADLPYLMTPSEIECALRGHFPLITWVEVQTLLSNDSTGYVVYYLACNMKNNSTSPERLKKILFYSEQYLEKIDYFLKERCPMGWKIQVKVPHIWLFHAELRIQKHRKELYDIAGNLEKPLIISSGKNGLEEISKVSDLPVTFITSKDLELWQQDYNVPSRYLCCGESVEFKCFAWPALDE